MGDLMNFDLIRLNNNIVKSIPVNEKYSFSSVQLKGTDLIKLDNVEINGEILKNSLGNIELNLDVEGVMVLPCAFTLKPVDYPFSIQISGELEELLENSQENSKKFKNTIDILPIIWENILMEIPMRVVSEDVEDKDLNMSGDGWKFVTEEEEKTSPLSELMDYLDDSEVK